jgi:hypothetical protein
MRGQPRAIAVLVGLMCLIRFSLALYGYLAPEALMAQLGAPAADNPQMPYIVRVWAIRDIVLAVLVVTARPGMLRPLLIACIVIDTTDIVSAWLAGRAGLFDGPATLGLMTTAVAALVPESLALWLLIRREHLLPAAKLRRRFR